MTRTAAQLTGDRAESAVADRLRAAGWIILGSKVRIGRTELDLIAIDPGPPRRLVAVEVRWRSNRAWGLPEETVRRAKLARQWAALLQLATDPARFGVVAPGQVQLAVDLVAVEPSRRGGDEPSIRHHRNVALRN